MMLFTIYLHKKAHYASKSSIALGLILLQTEMGSEFSLSEMFNIEKCEVNIPGNTIAI